jgi:molybdopterin/thiamine biosynthesis adenylyltransferase
VALPAFGAAGQGALARARVLLVGAGGLGSAAAFYLAAAGVGTLAIADSDVVEASNLHRQIIHTQAREGGLLGQAGWLRSSQPCCPFADAARAALRRRAWARPRRRPPPRRAAR